MTSLNFTVNDTLHFPVQSHDTILIELQSLSFIPKALVLTILLLLLNAITYYILANYLDKNKYLAHLRKFQYVFFANTLVLIVLMMLLIQHV